MQKQIFIERQKEVEATKLPMKKMYPVKHAVSLTKMRMMHMILKKQTHAFAHLLKHAQVSQESFTHINTLTHIHPHPHPHTRLHKHVQGSTEVGAILEGIYHRTCTNKPAIKRMSVDSAEICE
jgi:hypothetical protein